MSRLLKPGIAVLSLLCSAFLVAACGDDNSSSDGGGGSGKTGGIIKIGHTSMPDFLDPALSFTVDGWQPLLQAYPGLVTFPHESGPPGAEPVPGLAEDLPEVSADGKTYTLQLRDNLKFSDGTPVKASDFKGSIERLLEQDSQGSAFFTGIVGAEEFVKTKKGGVSGIKTDDETGKITIELTESRGSFTYELAIPFAGVVPGDTPAKNQTKNPPPGAGYYVIEDVNINRSYKLRKNPNFSPGLEGTAIDAGNAEGFDVGIYGSEANQVTRVSRNQLDFMIDNPPPDRAADIASKYRTRYRKFPTVSTFYYFLNAEAKPFDDLKVRQAVNFAVDPEAIDRIQGGFIAQQNEFLPPAIPGHEDTPDLYPHDPAKAKALIKEAGAEGEKVTVWGNPEIPTKPTVEYLADVMNEIGLEADVKIIASDTYFTTVGDRSQKAQAGWYNWFQDYPHPSDFLDVLQNPDNVAATGNNNVIYNAKDRDLAKKINAASAEPELTDEVKKQWAEIDREVQEKAYGAIYGTREQSTFMSERMDFENCKGDNYAVGQHDWAQFCLK